MFITALTGANGSRIESPATGCRVNDGKAALNTAKSRPTSQSAVSIASFQLVGSTVPNHQSIFSLSALRASIRSATENFRITEERFREQLTTNTEVLDAQTLLSQARNNYNTALTQYNVAEARLRRAMGGGLPEGVEPPRC